MTSIYTEDRTVKYKGSDMKWKFRFGAALGNMLEYYDIAVFAAISVYLSAELERLGYNQATEMVWGIFALRFLVRPIGGYVIGRYADKVGKKPALILTSLITGISTFCMALLPIQLLGAYTPLVILVIQMALSFSFAGEYPSLITYLLNGAASNQRSRIATLPPAGAILGVIISLGLVLLLERTLTPEMMQAFGWRIPLLFGVVNIAISFWFRARLPNHPVVQSSYRPINWYRSFHVFLLGVPATLTFYAQNISSSVIVEHLNIGDLRSVYAILTSSLLLIVMVICAWLTDKYSSSIKIFNIGVTGLVIFSIPLYYIMSNGIIEIIIIAQLIMTIFIAMIMCNVADKIVTAADGQTTTLSIGFNFTAIFVGGLTPLIISYLSGFNLIYVGVFLALCSLTVLLSSKLSNNIALQ